MLNEKGIRELAYVAEITDVRPIEGYDRVELVVVNDGWTCVVGKGQFNKGDLAVYFEIDSKLPEREPFSNNEFIVKKKYKVQTQRMCRCVSQGLIMGLSEFGFDPAQYKKGDFLTEQLGVTYATKEDNIRKGVRTGDRYKRMAQKHPKAARTGIWKFLYQYQWGKKLLYIFFGHEKKRNDTWPVGKFPGVNKTDQERVENMPWILKDKTPFIVTQKCDGSSATYILERKKHNKYEFYVCSRNVRMMSSEQECFYGPNNYYWEAAKKYKIEEKMKDYLEKHKDLTFVCWQGEICAPGIQKNPHNLKETHLYLFHWTDNTGRWDIRDANKVWVNYQMEVVPIVGDYIMPDTLEELKLAADGYYDSDVCEGHTRQPREGFVYYKTTDPTFSFKNVSREYLLKH